MTADQHYPIKLYMTKISRSFRNYPISANVVRFLDFATAFLISGESLLPDFPDFPDFPKFGTGGLKNFESHSNSFSGWDGWAKKFRVTLKFVFW